MENIVSPQPTLQNNAGTCGGSWQDFGKLGHGLFAVTLSAPSSDQAHSRPPVPFVVDSRRRFLSAPSHLFHLLNR